jgi:hypothetical protein
VRARVRACEREDKERMPFSFASLPMLFPLPFWSLFPQPSVHAPSHGPHCREVWYKTINNPATTGYIYAAAEMLCVNKFPFWILGQRVDIGIRDSVQVSERSHAGG